MFNTYGEHTKMSKQILEMQLDFKDVLIKPAKSNLTSRSQVHLVKNYHFKHSPQVYHGVPVIVANMDTTGTMSMAKKMASHHCMTAVHKHYSIEQLSEFFAPVKSEEELKAIASHTHHLQHSFYSMGIVEADVAKLEAVVKKVGIYNWQKPEGGGIRMICIDVANGYMQSFVDFCASMRKKYPALIIMAGNVIDDQMTQELLLAGVDIVKVGIGSGSVCQTRVVAGTGRPQLSAILDCQEAADHTGGYIVSDGGITCIADFCKVFAVGCFGVMAGGMFAGHEESELEVKQIDGKDVLEFYGMSSAEAMKKYAGGVAKYRASEGKVVYIPYKGSVEKTINDILGGVRSAHTYVGAHNLDEFKQKTVFYRVSQEVNEIYGKSK